MNVQPKLGSHKPNPELEYRIQNVVCPDMQAGKTIHPELSSWNQKGLPEPRKLVHPELGDGNVVHPKLDSQNLKGTQRQSKVFQLELQDGKTIHPELESNSQEKSTGWTTK